MSGGFGTGLKFLRDQQEQIGGRGSGNRMFKLWLKNGDTAKFWFIQDHEDIAVPLVHMVERKKKNGEAYNADVLCARKTLSDDPKTCAYCVDGERGPWPRYVAIVWVDIIVHPTRPEGKSWQPIAVTGATGTFYKEEVKGYQLLIMRDKLTGQLTDYLTGDPISDTPPPTTILDRGWRYKAMGERANKMETLTPDATPTVPDAVIQARRTAPSLEETIIAEFGAPKAPTVASGNGLPVETGGWGQPASSAAQPEVLDYFNDEDGTDLPFEV